MLDNWSGVSGMLRSVLWLEDRFDDLEILFVGRDGLEKKEINSRLEIAGKHLGYTVVLDNGASSTFQVGKG
jgi:hypothetical protein